MKSVNQAELVTAIQSGARVIDVRETFEYETGHIPSAKNIPMSELEARLNEVNAGDYLICHSGARSASCCAFLGMRGVEVVNVLGGMSAWRGETVK